MTEQKSALTVGGLVHDSIAVIADTAIERMTMHNNASSYLLVEAGKKVDAAEIIEGCGGGAANAAISLSRLGLNTSVLGKTGFDGSGTFVRNTLKAAGVDTSYIRTADNAPTGQSIILTAHDRDASIFVNRGANTYLDCQDIQSTDFSKFDLVCITTLSGASADCFSDAARSAREAGARVLAIPGARQISTRGEEILETLPSIDMMIFNRREAAQFIPFLARAQKGLNARLERSDDKQLDSDLDPASLLHTGLDQGGFTYSLAEFASGMLGAGLRTLIITDGGRGSWAAQGDRLVHTPTPRAEINSTIGAGDAFSSTFAGLTTCGWSLERALIGASVNASSVVSHLDTQSGLLPLNDLEARLEAFEGVQREWHILSA